jgi:hypothetical protein
MAYSVLTQQKLKELDTLSSRNLGITDKKSSTYLRTDSRTLIIGLGGMGQETVCRLKQTLTKRIGRLSPNMIQFLVLDTAANELEMRLKENELQESEVVRMHAKTLETMFEQPTFMPPDIKAIIPPNYTPTLRGNGAGQYRLSGKLTMYEPSVFNSLTQRIGDAVARLKEEFTGKLYIYIVAGVGGGTGSGTVIDIPYLTRYICTSVHGLSNSNISIIGNIYLPNVHKMHDTTAAYRNGYAALKEIDYYMKIEDIKESYTAYFPGNTPVKSQRAIFDSCILISGEPDIDTIKIDPREYAITACNENIASLVTNTSVTNEKDNTVTFFVDSFLDNTDTKLQIVLAKDTEDLFPKNANYIYRGVGAGSIKFPNVQIFECLVGGVYNKMTERLKKNVEKLDPAAADYFEKTVGLDIDSIIKPKLDIFAREIDELMNDSDYNWTPGLVQGANARTKMLRESTSGIRLAIANRMIKHEIIDSADTFRDFVITAANQEAIDIFKNDLLGPYYLKKLLESRSATGGGVVGFFERIESYSTSSANIVKQCEQTITAMETKLSEFFKEMEGSRSKYQKNIEQYKEIIKDIYLSTLKKTIAEKLNKEYYIPVDRKAGVCYALKTNIENNRLYFCDIVEYLAEIMEANEKSSKRSVENVEDEDNILGLKDEIFTNIKSAVVLNLNKELTTYDSPQFLGSFTASFLGSIAENQDSWRLHEDKRDIEDSCIGSFRKFFADKDGYFKNYANCSFSEYLELAYKTENDDKRGQLVNRIISILVDKAALSYNTWESTQLDRIPELNFRYIILPKEMNVQNTDGGQTQWAKLFRDTINAHAGVRNDQVMYSSDENAIFCYNSFANLPLWMHKRIKEYEEAYKAYTAKGIHTNESPQFFPPYKEYPSLFIKESWKRETNTKYVDEQEDIYQEKLRYVFNKAIQYGIIRKSNDGNYELCIAKVASDIRPTINIIGKDSNGNFSVNEIAKENLDAELLKFVDNYIDDNDNKVNGVLQSDDSFYKKLCANPRYTPEILPIIANHYRLPAMSSNNEDNAFKLLRKQIQITGRLLSAFPIIERLIKIVDASIGGDIDSKRRKQYYDFILYGFVVPEDGVWHYFDTKKNEMLNFTSERRVKSTNPELADYMELASYKVFIGVENYDKIEESLKGEVDHKMDEIDGKYKGWEEKLKNFNDMREKYREISERVETEYAEKKRRKNLSTVEKEIVDFYEGLAKAVK